mgnify:CR=1 FL=1
MEPYRLFFPAGLAFGVAGVLVWGLFGLWALFDIGHVSVYPSAVHADLMAGGFLFCFITGFLMTAVPRFFGAFHAGATEKVLGLAVAAGLFAAGFTENRTVFHAVSVLGYVLLGIFYLRRLWARTFKHPPEMNFVALGLVFGWLVVVAVVVASRR